MINYFFSSFLFFANPIIETTKIPIATPFKNPLQVSVNISTLKETTLITIRDNPKISSISACLLLEFLSILYFLVCDFTYKFDSK